MTVDMTAARSSVNGLTIECGPDCSFSSILVEFLLDHNGLDRQGRVGIHGIGIKRAFGKEEKTFQLSFPLLPLSLKMKTVLRILCK